MELARTPPRYSRQTTAPTQVRAMTRVDIALFNGFALPEVAAVIEIFQKANSLVAAQRPGRARYDVSLLSAAGGRIASSSSVFVWTDDVQSHRGTNDTHLLFIAGGAEVQQASRDERLSNWLRRRHPFSEIVHPIAEGRLILEAAGLPSRYCQIQYGGHEPYSPHPAQSLTEAPGAVSTALRIVEENLGSDLAREVAASIVPQHHSPFTSPSTPSVATQISEKIMASARWLEANVDLPVSIDDAAQVAAMSERNFLRRFKSEIGMTPSDYLLRARLNMSCRMLLDSSLPIDKIARRCGISGGGRLAKLFRKYLATTPTDYRNLQARAYGPPVPARTTRSVPSAGNRT
ncbi:transcriptional regulator GlxA family with amidase domain [Paraburkholderia sp. BL18I3N2]|uniref:GlxA family transcriptional regulator n=1 Tax=unclassified Paraburkholderia TaxID=2615204 RepID=UPI000D075AF3|nr:MULTISPECIES: helix-turn-helix domain-containing protein [unclassified Paraburkholderia]PRX26050.1 transcriptional regulator GlxA family with amidase domain [Paraburkholderia sp. BL18I3N2]PRX90736.1 transcriptional regulator GlxA family with amidase domain [Paraburkholderia sp. BL25I1N1]